MNHSQNNEQQLIINYFAGKAGNVLDLGANDGITLSNSYDAIQRGWSGVLVEPSQKAFEKLLNLYESRHDVLCYNVAIGKENGEADFYESGEHLGTGDTSLLSTLVHSELKRWAGTKNTFTSTKTQVVTWDVFYDRLPVKQFDLVSVDCEGLDYYIMSQMDLEEMEVKMFIVEWNGKDEKLFTDLAERSGLKLYSKNGENLIFVK